MFQSRVLRRNFLREPTTIDHRSHWLAGRYDTNPSAFPPTSKVWCPPETNGAHPAAGGGGDLEGYNPNDPRPTPPLPDGKPNFSGVWTLMGGNLGQDAMPPFTPGGAPSGTFRENPDRDDPSGFRCIPEGMPRIIVDISYNGSTSPGCWFFSTNTTLCTASCPPMANPFRPARLLTRMGTSVAKCDGDTLVIDTVGFMDHPYHWFDAGGHKSSDALHIIERLTRKSFQTVLDDVTFDDPGVWTKTWT